MPNKQIHQLDITDTLAENSFVRSDSHSAEDVRLTPQGVATSVIAEGKMQGVNVELAQSVTDDKRRLSLILKSKNVEVSQTADYATIGKGIADIVAVPNFEEYSGAYIEKLAENAPFNAALENDNVRVVYARRQPYAVSLQLPNKVNLYKIESSGAVPKFTLLRSIAYEEMDFTHNPLLFLTFRNSYFVVVCPTGTQGTSGYQTYKNYVFKLNLSNETFDPVELSAEAKGYIGDAALVSVDDSLTMCTVYDTPEDNKIINLHTGQRYSSGSYNYTYYDNQCYIWVSASCLIAPNNIDRYSPAIFRWYDGELTTMDGPAYTTCAYLDIPEKQCVLIYTMDPRTSDGWTRTYKHSLLVWKCDYYNGPAVEIYNQVLPYLGYLSDSESSSYRNHDNNPAIYKNGDWYLIVPAAANVWGSFLWNIETDEIKLPYIKSPVSVSNVYDYKGSFNLGQQCYTVYKGDDSYDKPLYYAFNVTFPFINTLAINTTQYQLTHIGVAERTHQTEFYSHLDNTGDQSGNNLAIAFTDPDATHYVSEVVVSGEKTLPCYGTQMLQTTDQDNCGYVLFDQGFNFSGGQAFTIEAMFNITQALSWGYNYLFWTDNEVIIRDQNGDNFAPGSINVVLRVNRGLDIQGNYVYVPYTGWNHLAYVYDHGRVTVFLNGTAVYTQENVMLNPYTYLLFGKSNMEVENPPQGGFCMQELRISNWARYTENFVVNIPLE